MRFAALDITSLCGVWLSMVFAVHPVGDFPINDDWVYAATVKSVLAGHYELYSWSSPNIGALAYWGALFSSLFGFSFTALRASTLILGLVGVIAVYFVGRATWADRRVALVVALAVGCNPVYFSLACTFMTDVPFVALMALAILALLRGIGRDDNRLVALGLVIALVTVTIRQFAVVVLAGYACAHLGRRGVRWKSLAVAILPLVAGLLLNAAYARWLLDSGRKPYPAGIPGLFAMPSMDMIGRARRSSLTSLTGLGLFLAPVALLCWPTRRLSRRAWVAIGFIALGIALVFLQRRLTLPITVNVLNWYGIGPLTNSDTFNDGLNLPARGAADRAFWAFLTIVAIVGSALLLVAVAIGAARLFALLRRPAGWPPSTAKVLLLAGTGLSYLAIMSLLSTRFVVFDRYLLPLTVLCALALPGLVADRTTGHLVISRGRMFAASAMLVVFAVFSVVTTHDFLAWSRTRWTALASLVDRGISPHRIDGGYEFNGWHLYDPLYVTSPSKSWWWVDDDEYLAGSGPVRGYAEVETIAVHRWWQSGGRDVVILHRDEASR